MKASEFDRYTICYQGIRHYREAVVSHLREVLQTTYPDKWESMLQKPFGKQWSIVVTNAEIRRTTGELTAPIVDCADYLGVHNFYNLFDSYFEDLFPAVALQETDTRKEQKAAILRWVKEIKNLRDPGVGHSSTIDIPYDDAYRWLDSCERVCSKIDNQAAVDKIVQMKQQLSNRGAPVPLKGTLPPRESIYRNFIGRTQELKHLNEWLQDPNSHSWFLAGDGGKGKTAIAYEFASRVQRGSSQTPLKFVIWLSAKRREFNEGRTVTIKTPDFWGLESGLDRILMTHNWTDELTIEDKKDVVLELLHDYPSLVVVDDVNSLDDQDETIDFLMNDTVRTSSKFLYTSRIRPYGMLKRTTQISGFPSGNSDGREFVRSRIVMFGLEMAAYPLEVMDRILRVTDGSPLFIEELLRQAMILGDPISRVCEDWSRRGEAAREYAFGREFEALMHDARRVLLAVALYNNNVSQGVSTSEVVNILGTGSSRDRVDKALEELRVYSLVPVSRLTDVDDVPRITLNYNTRQLVLEVGKSSNNRIYNEISNAVNSITGVPWKLESDTELIWQATRRVDALQGQGMLFEAEEILIPIRCNNATNHIQQRSHSSFPRKRESIRPPSVNTAASHRNGIRGVFERIPETSEIYAKLGLLYIGWTPKPRMVDARENLTRAAQLKFGDRTVYVQWCKKEQRSSEWNNMLEAAAKGSRALGQDMELEYFAGYAHRRIASELTQQGRLDMADRELFNSATHLQKAIARTEWETMSRELYDRSYQVFVTTLYDRVKIGVDDVNKGHLMRLAGALNTFRGTRGALDKTRYLVEFAELIEMDNYRFTFSDEDCRECALVLDGE